jgi:phage-related protein
MADEEPTRKPLHFIGPCKKILQGFPRTVQRKVGGALDDVQWGYENPAVKVLGGFGNAMVREVVADDVSGTYRVAFTLECPKAIYVLHAFQKKSKKGIATAKEDLDLIDGRRKIAEEHYDANYEE